MPYCCIKAHVFRDTYKDLAEPSITLSRWQKSTETKVLVLIVCTLAIYYMKLFLVPVNLFKREMVGMPNSMFFTVWVDRSLFHVQQPMKK